jgi:hypothetical protein
MVAEIENGKFLLANVKVEVKKSPSSLSNFK